MGKRKTRTRKLRRSAKAAMKYGTRAKRAHRRIGGRTGAIHHKKLGSRNV